MRKSPTARLILHYLVPLAKREGAVMLKNRAKRVHMGHGMGVVGAKEHERSMDAGLMAVLHKNRGAILRLFEHFSTQVC